MVSELVVPTTVMDDVEFAQHFNSTIAAYYLDAARYQKTLPEFSLMRMRQVVEGLCNNMASYFGLAVPADHSLFQLITDLKESGKFKKAVADDLHFIRLNANNFVHAEKSSPGSASGSFSSNDLVRITQNCRDALCRVLVAFAASIKGVSEVSVLQQRQFDLVTHQELIAKGVTAMQPKDKYLAGIAVDALTQHFLAEQVSLIFSEQQKFQYWSLQRLAATFYLAAIELDAELDQVPLKYRDGSIENLTFTRSDAEYLFRFANVVVHGDIGDELKAKGVVALESAATQGHVTAKALLAGVHYQNAKYALVLNLAEEAYAAGEMRALKVLFYYYAEGLACKVDKVKAQEYLEFGVTRNYLPAMTLLGKTLCSGTLLEKNQSLGLEYLKRAAAAGDSDAIKCLPLFNGTQEQRFKDLERALMNAIAEHPTKQKINNPLAGSGVSNQPTKIGANEPCPCGSGKKYKKCCKA